MHKFTVIFLFWATLCQAQDDLMKELEKNQPADTEYTSQTFKGTRIVNGQSVETKNAGVLEFIISHRFGEISGRSYELWGLDESQIRLGLEYGITKSVDIGIGRNSFDKTYDGFVKIKLARQSKGVKNFPFTITGFGGTSLKTSPKASDNPTVTFTQRLAYVAEVMVARKFNSKFSMQVTPVFLHRNGVYQNIDNNDLMALGIGGRYKITKSVALSGEYYPRLNVHKYNPNYNSLGFGVDIETGGHVFQLVFTNSRGMFERAFLSESTGSWADGNIHFGFNITRTFQLKKLK